VERAVLHIAGQSREQFTAYISQVCEQGSACPLPVGAAAYASLHQPILDATTLGTGNTQDIRWLAAQEFIRVVHVGLWLHPMELDAIAAGAFDTAIDRLRAELATIDRRVLLRVGYEFDGPHNNFAPDAYRRAFRHIAERLRSDVNIELVWHSYAWEPTAGGEPVSRWYPGDEVVDWIGMTVFSFDGGHRARSQLFEMAERLGRPVLLAECSPIRVGTVADAHGDRLWSAWFEPFLQLIDDNDAVQAVSMIECDWDETELSRPLGWGNARIASDAVVLERWRAALRERSARWIHGTSSDT
jgi:hypothetical protein